MLSDSGCNKLDKSAPEFKDWRIYWEADFRRGIYDEIKSNHNMQGMGRRPPTLLNWAQRTLNCSISGASQNAARAYNGDLPKSASYTEHQSALRQRTQLTSATTSVCNELIRRLGPDEGKSSGELGELWWAMLQASYRSNNRA